MTYALLKALHLAALALWMGGLLLLALMAAVAPAAADGRLARAVLAWDRRVTVPAMLALWALGLALAVSGGWFGARWLSAKLVLVVLLSGLHGVLAAALRRRAEGRPAPAWQRHAPALAAGALGLVALLVGLKP